MSVVATEDRDCTLTGVWPVIDERLLAHPDALMAEAVDDLARLAHDLRVELTGEPARLAIRPGREVPGSGGARWVVHALAPARRKAPRPYSQRLAG